MKLAVQTTGVFPGADISASFWQEWEQYKDYLYRCCLKWMGNPIDAEDALSRAMLKAYEQFQKSANRIDNFKAWLTKLTRNLCLDIHRELKRRALPVADFEGIVVEEELASQEETPVLAATRRELELFLKNAIQQLPPRLKETLVLFFYEEKSYQEIATELNISYDNVRQRISQARAILRLQLQEYEGEEASSPPRERKGRRGDGETESRGNPEVVAPEPGRRGDRETESRGNPEVVAPEP
ncbi:MAG TPA: sigma-70 family RNA polymerase sigma factor [Oscillatoriaceae cyanobacterium M33_DOE_052]|uniref:Sigma-70 family RNA polymerase sigma factor n=1 Tax=Planktothricoides sp. SpSt-374 TaxID=2282167 RepID=A0A7C3VRJ6_9CYAN|nr:sigma-70 family RNA polymerase sigma factor [Oscillatoriaceae cyanobacterium M33_DOE_052]